MKIVTNKTLHCIYVNGSLLVPGTNCLDTFDAENACAKAFIDAHDLVVSDAEKMDEKAQEEAIKNANTHATLEKLGKTFKKADISKQKKKLDDFDKSVNEANGESSR